MRLHSFSVANYRSFKDPQRIEFSDDSRNVTAIYGPNGAGKTNLYKAMMFYRDFIHTSTRFEGQTMQYEEFLLSTSAGKIPTSFEAEMKKGSKIYQYGFSLLLGIVKDEYLKIRNENDSHFGIIFRRNSMNKENRYAEKGFGSDLLKRTRPDALVLTKAWEDNNKYAKDVFDWLDNFNLISGKRLTALTAKKTMEDPTFKQKVLDLLRSADMYIQDLVVSTVELPDKFYKDLPFTEEFKANLDRKSYEVSTLHVVRDENGIVSGVKKFDLATHESTGTKRFFDMAYPLLDTIENGRVLYIDEFENNLHPTECKLLAKLFEDWNNNKKAQLIINTHCTQLQNQLGKENIRFINKNHNEESKIETVPSYIRNDDVSIERKYNKGLLGAIPNVRL